jgi:hypothetical protein
MTLNTKTLEKPLKKETINKSKSPKKNKRITKQETKAPHKKRGKKLEDDADYFKKSIEKIREIKAILKTAKKDKMPVKLR